MFEVLVLVVSCIANVSIGMLVYLKNPKSVTNRSFLILTTSFVLWSIANYFSLHPFGFDQIFWVRLVMLCAAVLCLMVYLTFTAFPLAVLSGGKKLRAFAIFSTLIIGVLTQTPLIFTTNNSNEPTPGLGMPLFGVLVLTLLIGGFINLLSKYVRSSGQEKAQLRVVIFGVSGTFSLILFANFILVAFFNNESLINFGPAFTLIFSLSFGYAIVRHRLFDVRGIVARAFVYLLALVFITVFYILVANLITSFVISSVALSMQQLVYVIGLTTLLVLLYPSLKVHFDKLTKKIFYRDAYDTQALIDELNQTLVSNTEVGVLLRKSAQIVQENLKTSFCNFYIRETSYFPDRIIGTQDSLSSIENIELLQILSPKLHHKVHTIESQPRNEVESQLTEILNDNGIEVMVRLVSTLEYELKGIGEILIGPKQNGSPYSKQDLKILEIIANELVIAIENVLRFEEIEEFNVTLQKKIDDATKELKKSNEKLKALDEAKDEFVSMASHQLRTPLTSIKGYVSMVSEEDVGKLNKEQKKMLGQALFSSQRMVYLISDLLNVSRLKTGKFIIERKPVSLPAIVGSELEQLKEGIIAKNITLAYEQPKIFPTLNLDEMKIRQVIMNFTDNAIYYTPSGGKITVQLKDKKESIEFTVKDTGIGVPKDERHKLFTKFYRADNARKARPDGTGLGLFMAKKVIIAQGGSIIFESVEGKGSTFGFSFPKKDILVEDDNSKDKS